MDNRQQRKDSSQQNDLEFYLPQDEFGYREGHEEFGNTKGEYFSDQEGALPWSQKFFSKKRSDHIRRMAMMLTCAATVGLVAPGLGPKAVTASITEASLEAEQVTIPESESPPEPESPSVSESILATEPTEEEIPYRLSEDQQIFISRVYQAFREDSRDALESLKDEEVFQSFLEGDLKGKVFLEGEETAFERGGFSGVGLLFESNDESTGPDDIFTYIQMSLVTLEGGQANGTGKAFLASAYSGENERNVNADYFTGTFNDNTASGEGDIYCKHVGWTREYYEAYESEQEYVAEYEYEQEDEGHGTFTNGRLTDGTGTIHQENQGTDNGRENVNFHEISHTEYTYANGMVANYNDQTVDLNTGEEWTSSGEGGWEQDHFWVVAIAPD